MFVKTLSLRNEAITFGVTPKVFTPSLGAFHVMWGAWCMDDPCLFCDQHGHVEVDCAWIARPCMDSYVAFKSFLGAFRPLKLNHLVIFFILAT